MMNRPMPQTLLLHTADDWQTQLRVVVTSGQQLLSMLGLHARDVGLCEEAGRDFALKVPAAFVGRMRPGDPRDPLLLQVLASRHELQEVPGYRRDPLQESGEANPRKGVIHKYRGRALLIVASGCAVNCRYCFRRHFPYNANRNSRTEWQEALDYIADDGSIEEVILSGGDPLVATDAQIGQLVSQLAAIPHIRRLRIHSRMPIVIPTRVTAGLLEAITHPGLQTVMVVHCNHANEIDEPVGAALARMQHEGITLLNQSVLLAGINDDPGVLTDLSERLFAAGVLPYYLHLLDKVQGAAHFDVAESRGRALVGEIGARLPGYLVPTLVRETPGARSKTVLQPLY